MNTPKSPSHTRQPAPSTPPAPTAPMPALDPFDAEADQRHWHSLAAKIRAVDPKTVRRFTLNPYDAAAVVLAQEPVLRTLVGVRSNDGLVTLDAAQIDDAVALAHAGRYLASVVDARRRPAASVAAQVEQAVTARDRYVRWIDMAVAEERLDAGARIVVSKSHAYAEIGRDLIKAARVLSDGWTHVEDFVPFTAADLVAANAMGSAMTTMAFERTTGRDLVPSDLVAVIAERDAAYELLQRAWSEIQRRVSYVRFAEGDLDRYAPSLFTRSINHRATAASDPPAAPAATPATVPVAPTTPPVTLSPEDSPFES